MQNGFESFVNSEGCKAIYMAETNTTMFESFVNSEGCKAFNRRIFHLLCLRALLIQKGVKLTSVTSY